VKALLRPFVRAARGAARAVRNRVDGALHPARRERARQTIRRAYADGGRVLFVCLGNICRSPYAEAWLRARTGGWKASSAGFIGPGRPADATAVSVARARGIDHRAHRSRVVDRASLASADALVVFDRGHLRRLRRLEPRHAERAVLLGDLDPGWPGRRSIPDPYGGEEEVFRRTFDRIERCVGEIARIGREVAEIDRAAEL